jgi:hypothetical protein
MNMKRINSTIFILLFGLTLVAQNLLVNPGFEQSSGWFGNGGFSTKGWTGNYYAWNGCGFTTGNANDGNIKLDLGTGGSIQTDDASLVSVTPGYLYQFSFHLQTYICNAPATYLGTFGYIYFLDGSNNVIKTEFTQSLQDDAVYSWQSFSLNAVAPLGAVKARVRIDASRGTYGVNEDSRNVCVDNCSFNYIPEDKDRLMIRHAPTMVEPGKTYSIVLRYAAISAGNLSLQLMNGSYVYGKITQPVLAGRGLLNLTYSVPSDAPAGTGYFWEASLPGKTVIQSGVFIDQTETGSGVIDADNLNIVYTGRNDFTNPKTPILYWFGSEIKTRFNGTAISLKCSTSGNGFGGYVSQDINYVIDDDDSNLQKLTLNGLNQTYTITSGLSNTTHTIRIMKASESADGFIVFNGFVLNVGRGLLKPDVTSNKKIEIYGNSVTSGGGADFGYLGYAPTLARALNLEPHIISKGGTGVAASFSGMLTQLDYWDKLDFTNAFDVSGCRTWDFNTWQADVVFVGTGHNDQFNGGTITFTDRFRTLLTKIETVYPNAQIFCAVPLISNPYPMLADALKPILSTHPRIHFRSQLFTDASVGAHPSTAAHQAMVYGDATRWSTAEWIEETMGWGIGLPGSDISIPVTNITVSPTLASIPTTLTQQLTVSFTPSDATIKDVLWISSNPSIATVSSSGLVNGVSPGIATITATSLDGNKVSTCNITVGPLTDVSDIASGTDQIIIYPNPLTGTLLTVSTMETIGLQRINIYDVTGKTVFSQKLKETTNQNVDLVNAHLHGIYIVKISSVLNEMIEKLCIK